MQKVTFILAFHFDEKNKRIISFERASEQSVFHTSYPIIVEHYTNQNEIFLCYEILANCYEIFRTHLTLDSFILLCLAS